MQNQQVWNYPHYTSLISTKQCSNVGAVVSIFAFFGSILLFEELQQRGCNWLCKFYTVLGGIATFALAFSFARDSDEVSRFIKEMQGKWLLKDK